MKTKKVIELLNQLQQQNNTDNPYDRQRYYAFGDAITIVKRMNL